jgi:predicted metal-dependent hydrolase
MALVFKPKQKVMLLGRTYSLSFAERQSYSDVVFIDNDKIKVYKSSTNFTHSSVLKQWLRNVAKDYIPKRTEELAERHGFSYKKIFVRSQKTRWGSCSSAKNLNFNWRLILTPRNCCDYVILHELCHLKEMNHSNKFWSLVEGYMPSYKNAEIWLKEEGGSLM